jgi:hypothetical protein
MTSRIRPAGPRRKVRPLAVILHAMEWQALAGVAVGALLTFALGMVTRWWESRARHQEWLRERRADAYASVIEALRAYRHGKWDSFRSLQLAITTANLYAGHDVQPALAAISQRLDAITEHMDDHGSSSDLEYLFPNPEDDLLPAFQTAAHRELTTSLGRGKRQGVSGAKPHGSQEGN